MTARVVDRGASVNDRAVILLGRRSHVLLTLTSLVGVLAFVWPFFADVSSTADLAHAGDAPWIFAAVLPLLLAILLAQFADGTLDAKAIAVLGVLTAAGAVLRLPSGGLTGFTFLFFLLIPAGRVYGAGFGFVLGSLTLFASALITGGVGPWLPFQMFAAGWVGLFAGMLPPARGRAEIWLLAAYGVVAGLAYGMVLNLWFWPFGAGVSELAFVPGGGAVENVRRFWAFHLATSLGFDIPRAAGNVVLIAVTGRSVLAALRRTARRAAFGEVPVFAASPGRVCEPSGLECEAAAERHEHRWNATT